MSGPDTVTARAPMPRLWLALGLLGWGVFTDNLAGGFVMALMLEAITLTPTKWAMAEREFHRAADLTSVIFAVVTVIQFSRYSVHGVYEILKVSPYCVFPLMLAQRASTAQTIPMSALFYSLRREANFKRRLDVAPHYLAICLLAASTTPYRNVYFAALVTVIVIGLLATLRPQRYRWWQWAPVLALALGLGFAAQNGILRAHRVLESSFMYWVNQFPWSPSDPNRAVTAIGHIGRLKLSDQIRVRVTPGPHVELPLLLQEASYDSFTFGTWSAAQGDFEALDKLSGIDAWRVAGPGIERERSIEITMRHRRDLVLLPAPRGTRTVESPEIAELQQNPFGSLMAESPPGALRYTAVLDDPASVEPPPRAADLVVPETYETLFTRINAEIGVSSDEEPAKTAERIRQFFLDNFTYSLIQAGSFSWRTPIARFLTETRRGHCEYFASSTVLLLRQAGIPARYAVGYAVENFSPLEGAYIARARHAHSWALAHVDGRWITIDSTPSVWYALEDQYASGWQSVQDFLGWLWFRYQRLSQADLSEWSDSLIWLVPPLAVVLYIRLRRSPTAVRQPRGGDRDSGHEEDTPLSELMRVLECRGLSPTPGETLAHFLERVIPVEAAAGRRAAFIQHYYRWRFSPTGGSAVAGDGLRREAADLVDLTS